MRKYNNIQKIETGQAVDYTTGSLLDYQYFKNYHKITAIDLSKQQEHSFLDPKAMQKINTTRNLDREVTIFFVTEEVKKKHFRIFTKNRESTENLFRFNIMTI